MAFWLGAGEGMAESTDGAGRPAGTLVTDFDGTLTRHDFFDLVMQRLVPAGTPDYWGEYMEGRRTHFETLRAIFASIRADEADVLRVVEALEPDPGLAESVALLGRAGWKVIVASAGCAWYISRVLENRGVRLEVHANPGWFEVGRGLLMEAPTDSPYFSPTHGIDKAAVVAGALAAGRAAFAGDGVPDLDAARRVDPGLRFARGALAAALRREGLAFRPFERWSDVAHALARSSST
jgi:2-hydroxy-3-keto-5-methylthiopentenyl-1-phosphate phosphatase